MSIDTDDIIVQYTVAAHELEPNDQIIIDGELFIIHSIDADRDDVDEILVKGENLTDIDNTEIPLFADDEFQVWSI